MKCVLTYHSHVSKHSLSIHMLASTHSHMPTKRVLTYITTLAGGVWDFFGAVLAAYPIDLLPIF